VPVELATSAGATVRGRVLSARDGRPVASARVRGSRTGAVLTAEDGGFELPGLPAGFPSWTLHVQAPGWAPLRRKLDRGAAGDELVLELEPEARVAGEVVDERGLAVEGAWVACGASGTRSDARGRFELGGLSGATSQVLLVRAQGRATWTAVL